MPAFSPVDGLARQKSRSNPAAVQSVLARLKQDTADAHACVDGLVDLEQLDRAKYREFLAALRRAYRSIDRSLAAHAHALAEFGYVTRLGDRIALLDSDIADLDRDREELNAGDIASAKNPGGEQPAVDLATPASAFGAIYVIEGATLGGQVIARHIIPSLALDPPNGCRFVLGDGDLTGPRWRETGQALNAFAAANPSRIPAMVDGAINTFALIEASIRSGAVRGR